jgi:hypothetical protein
MMTRPNGLAKSELGLRTPSTSTQQCDIVMQKSVFRTQAAPPTDISQFSKKSRSAILPSLGNEHIVLPPDHVDWLIAQPDSLVSNLAALKDVLQPQYTMLDPQIIDNPTHHEVIRGDLTRKMAGILPEVAEEAAIAFEDFWGISTDEWSEVCVFETVTQIVCRIAISNHLERFFLLITRSIGRPGLKSDLRWARSVSQPGLPAASSEVGATRASFRRHPASAAKMVAPRPRAVHHCTKSLVRSQISRLDGA